MIIRGVTPRRGEKTRGTNPEFPTCAIGRCFLLKHAWIGAIKPCRSRDKQSECNPYVGVVLKFGPFYRVKR